MGLVKRRSRILMGSAALAVLAFAGVANAQNAAVIEDEKPATSSGKTTLLQRIIVGAGNEKIAIDTPQAVTVINQDDLDREGATTIGEAFDEVPGVTAIGSDRITGQSFNIRGIGTLAASDESKIIITVDGATKFYEQYRMGSFFSDPELYKKIEILRGPASSTLYGSGAYGGVINLTTKDASDFLEDGQNGVLRIKGAFDSNRRGFLNSDILAVRLGENTDLLITGNYREAADYVDGNGTEVTGSKFTAYSGLVKGTHRFGMDSEQVVRLSYQRWISDAKQTDYSQTGTQGFGKVDRETMDETVVFSYENPASDNDNLNLKVNISFSNTEVDQGPADFFAPSQYAYETFVAKVENTFESTGDDFENFLTIGTQYSHQIRTAQQGNNAINYHPEGVDTKIGLYVQDEFIFDERLTIIPGIRVDFITQEPDPGITSASTTENTAISPKIAAMYKFNETFSLFGSIAHTERVATLDELFSFAAQAVPSPMNPNPSYQSGRFASLTLGKEKSDNYEIGFTVSRFDVFSEGDGLQLKTTFFQNNLEDLIATNPDTHNALPVAYYVNIDKAQIQGMEIEAAYNSDTIFGSMAYSRIRGKDLTTNIGLNSIPADNFSFTLGKRIEEMDLEFGWRAQFYSPFDTPASGAPHKAHSVHGIFVSWKPQEPEYGGFEVRSSVENIFNEQYKNNLAGDNGKGLTFKLSLVKEFGW